MAKSWNGKQVLADGKVIGEFICRGIVQPFNSLRLMAKESCLTEEELVTYSNGKPLYDWRISDLKIYDKPKELREFYEECKNIKDFPNGCSRKSCAQYYEDWQNCYAECCTYGERPITRPPQSWQYVKEHL